MRINEIIIGDTLIEGVLGDIGRKVGGAIGSTARGVGAVAGGVVGGTKAVGSSLRTGYKRGHQGAQQSILGQFAPELTPSTNFQQPTVQPTPAVPTTAPAVSVSSINKAISNLTPADLMRVKQAVNIAVAKNAVPQPAPTATSTAAPVKKPTAKKAAVVKTPPVAPSSAAAPTAKKASTAKKRIEPTI